MKSARIKKLVPLDYAGTEAMNTICANLSFVGRGVKKIIMTSCDAGEGKSYLTMQIAQNMAGRGKRVIVIDGDLRKSAMIRRCGMETDGKWIGLAHYLSDYHELDDIIYQTNIKDLYYISIGQHVLNPIPLLNSSVFSQMLDELASRFDLVLVDAPPIGLVIDAAEMAQICDGCVLVVEYEKTRRKTLASAKRQIEQSNCPIIGCIVNKVSFESISSKKYYHQKYYSNYGYPYNELPKEKKRDKGAE